MMVLAATDKQISFMKDMASEVLGSRELGEEFIKKLHDDGALQSRVLVSGVIDELITKRNAVRAERAPRETYAAWGASWAAGLPVLDPGMYKTDDGTIYKVQIAVHGSKKPYAKRLVPPTEFGTKASFVYTPGAIRTLSPAQKMSLEDAKAFGALYGTCCVCGRTLTDERSIEAGIGPVCATKF